MTALSNKQYSTVNTARPLRNKATKEHLEEIRKKKSGQLEEGGGNNRSWKREVCGLCFTGSYKALVSKS